MDSEFGATAHSKAQVNLDRVGIWWTCWASIWTFLLTCGMVYLFSQRNSHVLRIRGIGLSLSAVALLHLYWLSVQLGYVVAAMAPGEAEYWIMGTHLPLGVALFHASNSRFLYVAQAQRKYLGRLSDDPPEAGRGSSLFGRFQKLDYNSKMVLVVGLGMGFQVSASLVSPAQRIT